MDSATLKQTLSTIHTFEDYEKLKQLIEKDLARAIIHKHQLSEAELRLFSDGTNIVFSYGEDKVRIDLRVSTVNLSCPQEKPW